MNVSRQPLEHEFYCPLKCAPASDAIHTTLTAAHCACDLTETGRRTAVVARWVGKLRGIAQLEGVETGLDRSFTIDREALEQGEVVLNVPRPAEGVSPGIPQPNVLRGAGTRRASGRG